jgi:hypothetical protein
MPAAPAAVELSAAAIASVCYSSRIINLSDSM